MDSQGSGCSHTSVDMELGLSWDLTQSLTLEVHVQTVIVEPCPILGEPEGLKKVTYIQPVAIELNLPDGQPSNLNANAYMHLASVEPKLLPIEKENEDLLEVEGKGTTVNTAIKENVNPHINL